MTTQTKVSVRQGSKYPEWLKDYGLARFNEGMSLIEVADDINKRFGDILDSPIREHSVNKWLHAHRHGGRLS